MAPVLRPGWQVNDPSISSTQFKASLPVTSTTTTGVVTSSRIAIVNNIQTGTFDLYSPNALGQFGSPIATYSPTQDKVIPIDQTTFDLYFNQNTSAGRTQLTTVTNSAKLATYDLAQLNTGTDPTLNQSFQNLQKLNGYKSLSNSALPGQRVPGATPENPNGGDPQAAEATKEGVDKGVKNANDLVIKTSDKTRPVTAYKNLRYPIDMNTKQDCIQFTMVEYRPRKLSPTGILQGTAQENRKPAQNTQRSGTVTLPIQPTISDNNVVKWGSEDMNALQAIAAAGALSTISEGTVGAEASALSISKLIGESSGSLKSAAAAFFAGEAAGVKGLLTRVTGGIVNPNTELLFQGPDLRTFNFTFSLSAREPDEAKAIKQIIRFFKQGMSVKRADTGLFLKSPHTFEIKYLHDGKEHPWINKIKECALTSCNVNYTPAGNYATYEDGAMTQYDVSLSFSELEPIYDDDYANEDLGGDNNQDTQIGF